MKPILLVTCRAGNEEWCENEIGNRLFELDPGVKVSQTRYRGLLIVYSDRLDPEKAYKYLRGFEYGFVSNIVPIQYYTEDLDELLAYIKDKIPQNGIVKLRIRVRGRRGLAKILWRKTIEILKEKNTVHDPRSKTLVEVNIVDDKAFFSMYSIE